MKGNRLSTNHYDSPVSAVCANKSKFQSILESFLKLSRKSDESDAMVDSTGAVFMTDVQDNAFFTTVQ